MKRIPQRQIKADDAARLFTRIVHYPSHSPQLIDKIDAALRRIEEGEYGYCEETGEKIGLKRLEARPIATLSIEAQERHESYEKTHIDSDED